MIFDIEFCFGCVYPCVITNWTRCKLTCSFVVGRFSRVSSGSTRLESGPETEPARVIDIKNITPPVYTTARDENGNRCWVEQPLELGPDGWKPLSMRERADLIVLKELFDAGRWCRWSSGPAW